MTTRSYTRTQHHGKKMDPVAREARTARRKTKFLAAASARFDSDKKRLEDKFRAAITQISESGHGIEAHALPAGGSRMAQITTSGTFLKSSS